MPHLQVAAAVVVVVVVVVVVAVAVPSGAAVVVVVVVVPEVVGVVVVVQHGLVGKVGVKSTPNLARELLLQSRHVPGLAGGGT